MVAFLLWFAVRAYAQVHGQIQDASGSPVAGAQVLAHNSAEHTDRAFASAADGSFTMNDLKPGHYQFKAAKRGFADSSGGGSRPEPGRI
jgi:protocatechuate 3,4-dioxygenase beta subunit